MPEIRTAMTSNLSFDEVIHKLSRQQIVDGLLLVGSMNTETMTPTSDYDLVVILAELPVPLHTGVTYIDGSFTDLVFHTTEQVGQILAATAPFDFWDWVGRLVGWLIEGKIVFDRHGKLNAAQEKVRDGTWIATGQ